MHIKSLLYRFYHEGHTAILQASLLALPWEEPWMVEATVYLHERHEEISWTPFYPPTFRRDAHWAVAQYLENGDVERWWRLVHLYERVPQFLPLRAHSERFLGQISSLPGGRAYLLRRFIVLTPGEQGALRMLLDEFLGARQTSTDAETEECRTLIADLADAEDTSIAQPMKELSQRVGGPAAAI